MRVFRGTRLLPVDGSASWPVPRPGEVRQESPASGSSRRGATDNARSIFASAVGMPLPGCWRKSAGGGYAGRLPRPGNPFGYSRLRRVANPLSYTGLYTTLMNGYRAKHAERRALRCGPAVSTIFKVLHFQYNLAPDRNIRGWRALWYEDCGLQCLGRNCCLSGGARRGGKCRCQGLAPGGLPFRGGVLSLQ